MPQILLFSQQYELVKHKCQYIRTSFVFVKIYHLVKIFFSNTSLAFYINEKIMQSWVAILQLYKKPIFHEIIMDQSLSFTLLVYCTLYF